MPRIAAIDFGMKRIGIALSDDRKKMALPFATVNGGKKGVANTAEALNKKKGEIEKILVGLPLLMSGKRGDMAAVVEKFAAEQKRHPGIAIGQLMHKGEIKYSHLREYLVKVRPILEKWEDVSYPN